MGYLTSILFVSNLYHVCTVYNIDRPSHNPRTRNSKCQTPDPGNASRSCNGNQLHLHHHQHHESSFKIDPNSIWRTNLCLNVYTLMLGIRIGHYMHRVIACVYYEVWSGPVGVGAKEADRNNRHAHIVVVVCLFLLLLP